MSSRPLLTAYAGGFRGLKEEMRAQYGADVQVWYTERNGDSIVCVMPADAKPEDLPRNACGYMVFEWIDPDKEFGTGVTVR